jgi:hypothetical protein
MSEQEEQQTYSVIHTQEFKSSIPPHLLGKLSEGERYLVETMSKLENTSLWTTRSVEKNNEYVRNCGLRVFKLEQEHKKLEQNALIDADMREKVAKLWDWKQYFSGKWAVLAALGLILFQVLLKIAFDAWHKL